MTALSKKAQEEFDAGVRMREKHLEETFGDVRRAEIEKLETFNNYALLNWILTLHDFTNKKGMDYLNAVQGMMMVHLNTFETKVEKMEEALGPEKMKELGIDTKLLYPSKVAIKGLEEVQRAARERARYKKSYLELEKENNRIIS